MKLALIIAVFLLSSIYTQTLVIAEESEYHDIIIIGAGMAGLAAANSLNESGYDVIVLEARDRIGGRILTDQSNGYYLDLGASWIHGIDNNPIKSLADDNEVKTKQFDDIISFVLYDKNGEQVYLSQKNHFQYNEEEEEYEPICDGATDDLERYCQIYGLYKKFQSFYDEKRQEITGDDISLALPLTEFIEQENLDENQIDELHYALVWWTEGEYGADSSEISLLSFEDMGYEMEGMEVIFPEGYRQIIDILADELDIRLEHVVTEIDYSADMVHIKTNKGDFDAKYVISTLPLGVLKNNVVSFSPPLPQEKITSINNLGMGVLNKVYYVFDEVFWDNDRDWIIQIPDEKGHWVYFANLNGVLGKPVLLAFNAANFGRELEAMVDEEIVEEGLTVLKKIYGDKIPAPVFTKVTKWGSDEFSFGSYSYTAVDSSNADFYELSRSLDSKVFFAGEATEVNYPATVHGAYFSGIREANKIQWLEGKMLSPKSQLDNWILPTYVICKDGLELLITHNGESAACVTEETRDILEKRGWGYTNPYAQ